MQHQDRSENSPKHRSLSPGPIAMEPFQDSLFSDAVAAGGGRLEVLGTGTRGLLWIDPGRAAELKDLVDAFPKIEWIQLPWAGVDAFAELIESVARLPVGQRPIITSAKGAYAEPVAEHALALTLACLREFPQKARDAHWQDLRTGLSLFGRNIVILGAGGVTRAFLDLVAPFRAKITVVRRSRSACPGAEKTVVAEQLSAVLPDADILIIAAAATAETRLLVGGSELALMPPHAILVNVARGSLVELESVVDAVQSGKIFGAGLDVMDPEPFPRDHRVWNEKRIIITSHSADTPEMTAPLLARRISSNVSAFLRGDLLSGVVDVVSGY